MSSTLRAYPLSLCTTSVLLVPKVSQLQFMISSNRLTAHICICVRQVPKKLNRHNVTSRRTEHFESSGASTFVEIEQLADWRTTIGSHQFDIISLDLPAMTGNDLILDTLALLGQLSNIGTPRALVVKSAGLSGLSWRLIHAQRLLNGTATLLPCTGRSSRAVIKASPQIVAAVGVDEYRKTIPLLVEVMLGT